MPVTTRAGAKRALGNANSTNVNNLQAQPAKRVKASKKASLQRAPTGSSAKSRTNLLNLPPEIRNRIYHFATEYSSFEDWVDPAPLLLLRWGLKDPETKRTRESVSHEFFGLTQVCKQIRAEYRPIWLRGSCLRLRFFSLRRFLDTFYPTVSDYQNAPKLLQISWDHWNDYEDDQIVNLHQLLQMRAHCATFKAEFVPHHLSQNEGPVCSDCGEHHDDVHQDAYDGWVHEQLVAYMYLPVLNGFLAHDNEAWLRDITENRIQRVSFTFDEYRDYIIVLIHFSRAGARLTLNNTNIADAATLYVEQRAFQDQDFYKQKLRGEQVVKFEIAVSAS